MQIKGKVKILIDPGYDLFETAPGTSFDFSNTPLPAGFFGPGSEQFNAPIQLLGTPLGYFHGQATGETDTTPIGAMGKVMQLVFAVLHPGNARINLAAAGVSANSASARCSSLKVPVFRSCPSSNSSSRSQCATVLM